MHLRRLVFTLIFISACSAEPVTTTVTTTMATTTVTTSTTTTTTTTVTPTTSAPLEPQACQQDGNTMVVNESCLDRPWPFSIEQGTLACDADAVTFETAGAVYALNGLAIGRDLGTDPDPIWLDNPEVEGFKISIGSLIDIGLSLCD